VKPARLAEEATEGFPRGCGGALWDRVDERRRTMALITVTTRGLGVHVHLSRTLGYSSGREGHNAWGKMSVLLSASSFSHGAASASANAAVRSDWSTTIGRLAGWRALPSSLEVLDATRYAHVEGVDRGIFPCRRLSSGWRGLRGLHQGY